MRGRLPRWRCPYCHARGHALTPDAARDRGIDHFLTVHDVPRVGGDVE